jgi:hypothetical protein
MTRGMPGGPLSSLDRIAGWREMLRRVMRRWDEEREALARAESVKQRLELGNYSDEDELLNLALRRALERNPLPSTKPAPSGRRTVEARTPWEEDELLNRYLFEAIEERERLERSKAGVNFVTMSDAERDDRDTEKMLEGIEDGIRRRREKTSTKPETSGS